jgi:hypothetical protein
MKLKIAWKDPQKNILITCEAAWQESACGAATLHIRDCIKSLVQPLQDMAEPETTAFGVI